MGKIDYQAIYARNKHGWYDMTEDPQRYEALLAGHYSDSNHFVYELLQNAEDARASKVVIEYYGDKLVFYHDGKPFDENDVIGVSSMLMGTKDRNDASTIGRFGMGFKSVFKYTYQPEIYSDDEAFRIESYLLPVEMSGAWNYQNEKKTLCYELSDGQVFYPFGASEHLTKFVIPFAKKKENGDIIRISGNEVLVKMQSLTGEILLFLSHIKSLYWIDKTTGMHARIVLENTKNDEHLITCKAEGTAYGDKEEINRYLKYKKVFNHPEMNNAEVSVAYKVNSRANNINEMSGTDIWVYFPTRDNTELPFLIHGSFETAVSREKLMQPSEFNNDLFDKLGQLIADSLDDLKQRKMITQTFIRRIILAAFKDEQNNNTIPGLKEKVTNKFLETALLPTSKGDYANVKNMHLAIPFGLTDFYDSPLFEKSYEKVRNFVAFNNEKETNFTEYFNWLINELDIKTFTLENWANGLIETGEQNVDTADMNDLNLCYVLLSDNRESLYSTNLAFTRSGAYERMIKNILPRAWDVLRKAPIVINAENKLVPAFKDGEPNIYLGASSRYKKVVASAIVNHKFARDFDRLFDDGFQIAEFDNFQFIKEKIIRKYASDDEDVMFEDWSNFETEYIEDLNQIFHYIEETHNISEIRELLEDAYIIKINSDSGDAVFSKPGEVYTDISDEGIDLRVYYAPIPYEEELDEDEWSLHEYEKFDYFPLNTEFYERNGISIKKLQSLGLVTSVVKEGTREHQGIGDEHWTALGEYCPHINFDGIEDNFAYIQYHFDEELAEKKSAEIMKLMLHCADKFSGSIRYRKNNPYTKEGKSNFIRYDINSYEWIYTKDGNMVSPSQISKYDLDVGVYGELSPIKSKYEILGFKETEADNKAETFELVESLDKRDKKILFNQLARELNMNVSEKEEEIDEEEQTFNIGNWISTEFPVHKVRNMESLIHHVREQFFFADPIKYEPVLRKIRTSKPRKLVNAYVHGMYTNESNVKICQMCKQPSDFIDVTEIANFGIELPQLNLCLCRNCSSKYKSFRDVEKDYFKERVKNRLQYCDIDNESNEIEIVLDNDVPLYFTQTHLAEIKAIFSLLDEYGIPEYEHGDIQIELVDGDVQMQIVGESEIKSPREVEFPVETQVKHRAYGSGTVVENYDGKITIRFSNGTEKVLDINTCKKIGVLTAI